ncbi:MAG: hypothetical protein A2928_04125 [Candidatus Taylorbacteria bacterium RIFCSPLOWO2_01_FULL_45_15b]|uniref:Uncharacterized protein n=1 Tax=Candidatus Taylorbacteria bacterium RIFCSPLOWO2_01_FULL_45_15b TaxID=1802319 RepID=A0A1G2ND67_9BACT|nr:MAG: hypothetical protein A2928_04125 [Candidatus Taylorbacteria bacterium RIFCSPLOWO2_01_FULL_45_15b]
MRPSEQIILLARRIRKGSPIFMRSSASNKWETCTGRVTTVNPAGRTTNIRGANIAPRRRAGSTSVRIRSPIEIILQAKRSKISNRGTELVKFESCWAHMTKQILTARDFFVHVRAAAMPSEHVRPRGGVAEIRE